MSNDLKDTKHTWQLLRTASQRATAEQWTHDKNQETSHRHFQPWTPQQPHHPSLPVGHWWPCQYFAPCAAWPRGGRGSGAGERTGTGLQRCSLVIETSPVSKMYFMRFMYGKYLTTYSLVQWPVVKVWELSRLVEWYVAFQWPYKQLHKRLKV